MGEFNLPLTFEELQALEDFLQLDPIRDQLEAITIRKKIIDLWESIQT